MVVEVRYKKSQLGNIPEDWDLDFIENPLITYKLFVTDNAVNV